MKCENCLFYDRGYDGSCNKNPSRSIKPSPMANSTMACYGDDFIPKGDVRIGSGKPVVFDEFYVVGYIDGNGTEHLLTDMHLIDNHTFERKVEIYTDLDEAKQVCDEHNGKRKANEEILHVFKRIAKYYDTNVY